jgi:glycosyltransferase involved in cell wall biosynthesis
VHLLTEELVRMGHDVTLCATGDSLSSASLESSIPVAIRGSGDAETRNQWVIEHAARSLEGAARFDVIHNHAGEEVMCMSRLKPDIPMLTTLHCLITPSRQPTWDSYGGYYNTLSFAQKNATPPSAKARFAGVVYNAVDVGSFPFQQAKEDFLLYLSRISPEKGPDRAIAAARMAGRRLLIAGKVDPADREYFRDCVEPLIDGVRVRFLGEADGSLKRELYRQASGLLMPIAWEEPFGLVMAEAQACGTPVIAFNRGAAPEVVFHGETGFVVSDIDEMAGSIRRLPSIDPAACRKHVEERFDSPVMAEAYVRAYRSILAGKSRHVTTAPYVNGYKPQVIPVPSPAV